MIKVKYVSKTRLFSAFGEADSKKNIIYIRKDLPRLVKMFVKEHEIYHLKNDSKGWLFGEIKASLYAASKHPIGFLMCLFMSLNPKRLKFYIKRFKRKIKDDKF